MDTTYLFAKNLANMKFEDFPAEAIEATKKQVLDLLGVMVGGFSRPGPKELRELITDWGGKKESSIIGTMKKVPAPNAAHVNATMAHALDYDDVHESAVMHPGVITIPTAMAMAEKIGNVNGREFIAAVTAGVDMMCRLGSASTPGRSPIEVGWHQTTLFGFMGSAAVAGRIMGLPEEKIVDAMGIAYHQCSGNGQCVKDGALTKRLGPGFSVKGGITAALLAGKGVTGAHNCLDGEWGLYKLYWRGDYDTKVLSADLGKRFEGVNVSIKPYPCCRGIHPAIDAALALVKNNNISADDVQEIKLFVAPAQHSLLCSPIDAKLNPRSPVDAQFSIPWGVSVAISRGRANLEDFSDEAIKSKDIKNMSGKISVEVDTSLKRADKIEPTRIEIKMRNGKIFSGLDEHPLGSPEKPMSFDDLARKFKDCAGVIPEKKSNKIIEQVAHLEKMKDVRNLISLLGF